MSWVYSDIERCRDSFKLTCDRERGEQFSSIVPRFVVETKRNCICGRVGIVNKYLRLSSPLGVEVKKHRISSDETVDWIGMNSLCAIVFVIWFTKKRNETFLCSCWMKMLDGVFCNFYFVTGRKGVCLLGHNSFWNFWLFCTMLSFTSSYLLP